jgi:hypothetical protein
MIDVRTVGSRMGLINGSSSEILVGVLMITPMLVGISDATRSIGCSPKDVGSGAVPIWDHRRTFSVGVFEALWE